MASEPSSTTIASEPSTSTSEIQADTTKHSQLEALALNYLRNQDISTIPSRIPKLNPCSICQKAILTYRFQSFVVLDCEHLFHRTCLEEYIMQGETKYPSCPSCPVTIYLVREEAVVASGEYHFRKKQTDTGQGNEELMDSLGLVEGGSRAGQGGQSKQVTMQDQATSPIVVEDDDDNRSNSVDNRTPENQANSNDEIRPTNTQDNLENQSNANSGDDTNVQESESQSRRNSSRQSLRWTSPRVTREQEKFQTLLQELSTPAKGEKAENVDDAEEDADDSASQSLARLYQKATRAGLRVAKANQDEILCWYKYAEGFENRVRDIKSQDSTVTDPTARSRAYREVSQHLPGITEANLRKKTQKARNIYKVFVRIGINKIKRVKSYSADAISNLSSTQIQSIIDRFSVT